LGAGEHGGHLVAADRSHTAEETTSEDLLGLVTAVRRGGRAAPVPGRTGAWLDRPLLALHRRSIALAESSSGMSRTHRRVIEGVRRAVLVVRAMLLWSGARREG
jgi:hypothetical protein